jgi:polyhydroxyalkanoate synthase subunit PhaC
MTKIITLKPLSKFAGKKNVAALPERLRAAHECPAYEQPSDDYHLDHIWHGEIARLTGGISTIALGLAGIDWWAHLMFSPAKQQALWQSYWNKKALIGDYALKTAFGVDQEPVINPNTKDQRFATEHWQSWPFNVLEQAFLLRQEWWNEATTGVRGVSKHHLNVVSYTARQILDITSPSNNFFTNPDILQTTKEQGGKNLLRGILNFLDDAERISADKPAAGLEKFEVGKNIAATKGKIVYRNKLIELIQYEPTTAEVYTEPILITPA